ncbi:MAG: VWA domain-containing protein [Candidatus Moranbacteria bacterium]|nr:VWA domain-containing protein [Candidatus Moranbacteria bacterium]
MTLMMTRKLRRWFRLFDTVVIFSMLLQPVAPAVIFSQEISSGDGASVATEASASTEAEAPKVEEKTAPVETKTEEVAAPAVEPVVVPVEEPKAEEPAAAVEPSTETAPVVSEPVQTVEPTEAPVAGAVTPEVPAVPTVEAEGEASAERAPEWVRDGDKETTGSAVELGRTYVAPQNDQVTVTFGKLPENPGKLSIEEVTLSDQQVEGLNALSNKAYDITSDMTDGTFEYSLTLPKPAEVGIVEVKFAEERSQLDDPQTVPGNDVKVGEKNVEFSQDHFTIYVTTYSDATLTVTKTSYQQGEAVFMKAGDLVSGNYYRFAIDPPGNGNLSYMAGCQQPDASRELTASYVLPADATVDNNWSAEIHGFTSQSNCQNANSNHEPSAVKTFAVTTLQSVANPALSQACGLDIALVLDNSGSISSTELGQMKTAMKGFVDALAGTPTRFSVTKFNTTASVLQNFTSDGSLVKSKIDSITSGSFTNWEDGLVKARSTFSSGTSKPNLVIFASDGDPNTVDNGSSTTVSDAVNQAASVANQIKGADNTRILVLGIGVGSGLSTENLKAISGPTVNGSDLTSTDVITTDFSGMSAKLGQFASSTCGGTITVNKFYDDVNHKGGAGWTFDVSGTTVATDSNGQTEAVPVSVGSGKTVTETGSVQGYSFGSASCTKNGTTSVGTAASNGVTGIEVGADDIISCDFINTTNKGTMIVQKNMVGGTGNFTYTGNPSGTISTNNGTITVNNVTPGTYTSTESAATGWTLSSISCDDGASATPSTTDVSTRSATFKVDPGETVKCTFTNTKQTGTLRVIKSVINDNGGSASSSSFNLHVKSGGSDVSGSPAAGSATGTVYTLNAGSYAVSEDAPVSGYAKTGFSGDCNSDGVVAVVAGQEKTCTITNDDIAPSLTLDKILVKDNGGSANESDWTLSATGTAAGATDLSGNGASGSTDVVSGSGFKADTYTLSETGGPSGYSASAWTCSNGVIVSADNKITLGLGKSTVCSITNNDQPGTLIVKKVVTNDNGGTLKAENFGFKVNGGNTVAFEADGQNDVSVNAGTYTVTEPGIAGYATTYDNCENVVVPNGGTATCTITNDDIPAHLIVIKHVNNDQGGSASSADFTMTINGITVNGGSSFSGQETPGTDRTVMPGSYTVTESGPDGYLSSMSADCAGAIAIGQTKTCTVTNEDKPATLVVKKHVVNDNGGVASADAFTMKVTGTDVSSGSFAGSEAGTTVTLDAGSYGVSEDAVAGYEASYSGCSGTIANGQTKTCIVTNDDEPAHLIVKKHVVNDSDGTKVAAQFATTISGVTTTHPTANGSESGVDNVLTTVGPYTVDEGTHDGYEKALSSECAGSIALGETKTCTITNDDIDYKPTIDVTKEADKASVPENGDSVTYTFTVKNTGPADAVTVASLFDDKLGTLVGDADCKVGTILPIGASCTFTLAATISGNAGTSHVNTFTAVAEDEEKNTATDSDDATVTFTDVKPTIEVAKSANPTTLPEPGGDATFSVTVRNTSFESVTLTSLSDDIYGDLNGKGTCVIGGTIAAGAEYACSFTGSVSGEPGVHTDVVTATVTDNDESTDTKRDDATVTITDVKPTIEVTKTANVATIDEPGGDVTYTFDVKNTSATESVTITMLVDDRFGTLSGDADCQVGTVLAAGASCSFQTTKSISGDANTSHTNIFRTIAVDNENNKADDSDDATVTFTDVKPSITIEKSVDTTGMAEPGGNFTYTLTIKNTSVETVSITALTDSNALSPACLALVGQTIAPNATTTCSYVVNHAVAGTYGNTAKVTVKDNENNMAEDDDSETVKVVGARIAFDKTAATNNVNVSHTFTVTVTENDGTGWTAASGEHVDFTLTDGSGAISTLDAAHSTCDDAGANTDTNGQCTIVFNSATPGTVTVHASANVSVGGLTLARSTDGALGSGADAVKTYQAGKIIIEKQTSPEGSAQSFEFTPNYGQKFSLSDNGSNDSGYLAPGTYSVSEAVPTGWTQVSAVCSDQSPIGAISLQAGETVTCVFTNGELPTLTLHKTVTNDNGGNATTANFEGKIGADSVAWGSVTTLTPGAYTASESVLSGGEGYGASAWEGDCATDGSIALSYGDHKTCTITNDDIAPKLTLRKLVSGGTASAADFNLSAMPAANDKGAVTISGNGGFTDASAYSNIEYTLSETGKDGYTPGTWSCSGATLNDNKVKLDEGGSATCDITNTRDKGGLKAVKVIDDGSDLRKWKFSLDNGTPVSADSRGMVDFGQVTTIDTHTIVESGPSGYKTASIQCSPTGGSVDLTNGSATTTVEKGKTTVCTFSNEINKGTITIIKDAAPDDAQDFTFVATGKNVTGFTLDDDGDNANDHSNTRTFTTLFPGTYAFTEGGVGGWDLTGLTCDETGAKNSTTSVGSRKATLKLDPGETITCTFVNTKRGHIVVEKQTLPDGDRTKFEFDPSWDRWRNFELKDGERRDSGILVPGTYSVREEGESGWDMTNVTCSDGSDPNHIALDPGEIVTCTFTNTKRAEITVKKDAIPDDSQDFTFSNNFGDGIPSNFTLDDDGWNWWPGHSNEQTFSVKPGTYSVAENSLVGWKLAGAVCSDGSEVSAINAVPGEHITCTFTNKKLGKIKLVKKAVGSDGTFDFAMSGTTLPESASLTTVNGSAMQTFSGIDPDNTYGISEAEQAGWSLTGVRCVDEKKDVKFDCDKDGRHDEGKDGDNNDNRFDNDNNNDKDDNRDRSGHHIDPAEFSMNPGGEMTCTFTNTRDTGRIKVNKVIDADGNLSTTDDQTHGTGWEFDVNGTGTDTGNPVPVSTGADGLVSFTGLKTGQYSVAETTQDGYELIGANCGVENGLLDGNIVYGVTVSKDAETVCTFYNTPNGTIHGQKWEDRDMDRERDVEGEPYLSGWSIFLDKDGDGKLDDGEQSTQTSSDENELGWYWFDHLFPGTYSVCEVMQDGWEQTYPSGETSCHTVTLPDNGQEESVENMVVGPKYDFGNAKLGLLSIEKENDTNGEERKPGETVKYTLKVTASEGKVLDVKTTDLPPEVATYVPDSWTAESSLGGAHVGNLKLDHVYASPGIWDLGELQDGEVVTLSYDATVNAGTDAGEYPDLAYAQGVGQGGNLYAMAGLGGNIEDGRYVGTAIAVADSSTPDPAKVTTDHTEKEKKVVKGRVLGATLPETGSPTFLIMLLGLLLILGAALAGTGYAMKKDMFTRILKKWGKGAAIFAFAMSLGFVATDTAKADSVPDLYIRAEKPAVAANGSFTLDFVTLDTDQSGAITVKCQVKKPGESDFTTFQSMTVQEGGDSGQCSVGAAELPDDGTYVFRVRATSGSEVATSKESTVSYDTIFPGKPKSIDKSYMSSCTNRVKLRTADDGQTTHVEVYRSTSEDFTADASTMVHTAAVGPNATYAYDDVRPDSLCGKKVFYAVRAFDDAGNASPVREEDISETNHVTVYEDTTAAGSVTLTPGAAGAGTGVEGAGSGSETVNGTVEGAQAGEQGAVEGAETASGGPNTWIWVIIAGAAAYGAYRYYIARKKGTPEVK